MRIYLDLLPPNKKEEIRKKRIYKKIIWQEIRFLLPVFVFLFMLIAVSVNLDMEKNNANLSENSANSSGELANLKTYENKFKEINSQTEQALKFEDSHLYWSQIFRCLSNVTPDNIFVTKFANTDYKLTISGRAKDRDALIKLQDNISADNCFEEVDVPLSNYTSRENVAFQIDFKIKEDCLKKQ